MFAKEYPLTSGNTVSINIVSIVISNVLDPFTTETSYPTPPWSLVPVEKPSPLLPDVTLMVDAIPVVGEVINISLFALLVAMLVARAVDSDAALISATTVDIGLIELSENADTLTDTPSTAITIELNPEATDVSNVALDIALEIVAENAGGSVFAPSNLAE
jgi:hypothetical protein